MFIAVNEDNIHTPVVAQSLPRAFEKLEKVEHAAAHTMRSEFVLGSQVALFNAWYPDRNCETGIACCSVQSKWTIFEETDIE